MLIDFQELQDGVVILGNIEDADVINLIDSKVSDIGFKLIILDPLRIVVGNKHIYSSSKSSESSFTDQMCKILGILDSLCGVGAATYIFGNNDSGDSFYRLMIKSEVASDWQIASRIVCESQKIMNIVNHNEIGEKNYFRRAHTWIDVSKIIQNRIKSCAPGSVDGIKIPMEIHTQDGDWVLDPFSKRGTFALLAREMGRKFVIVENDCEDFTVAIRKLSQ